MPAARKSRAHGKPSAGAEGAPAQPRREAEGRGAEGPQSPQRRADAASGTPAEPRRPRRRRLTAQRKFEIFLECSAPGAPIGEILRREGLYSSDLARIRDQVRDAAVERLKEGPGRKRKVMPPEEVDRLVRELQEKERALAALSVEYLALKKDESRASRGR